MVQVHLVDGTYELFRSFYGGPSSKEPAGREVGAVRTLARSLLALLREPQVSHVACAFDHVIESFRNELFPGYKTGEGIDPALRSQFDLAEQASRALGLVTWSMVEFEADDALATGAELCARDPRVERIALCSPDKDLAQCVQGERVVMLDRMRKKSLDEAAVRAKFGVPPELIPDYLALVGDSADGIPGIDGWGPKSAAAILSAHGGLAQIPADSRAWTVRIRGAERLAESLGRERQLAELYRTLATLRRDVPLGVQLDDLRWRGPTPELDALARDIHDGELVQRAREVWAAKSADLQ